MSRVGKKPVPVPSGVTATVDGQMVKVKGTKGELSFLVPEEVSVALEDGAVAVEPRDESKTARAQVGHVPRPGGEPGRGRDPRASRSASRSTASATRPPLPARC